MKSQLELCYQISEEAHKGQTRKYSDEPYIIHPKRVAEMLENHSLKCIAFLHDVIEDTPETIISLKEKGVDDFIVNGVEILTKPKNLEYDAYIYTISLHKHLSKIKVADMMDNLCSTPSERQKTKYRRAMGFLLNEI